MAEATTKVTKKTTPKAPKAPKKERQKGELELIFEKYLSGSDMEKYIEKVKSMDDESIAVIAFQTFMSAKIKSEKKVVYSLDLEPEKAPEKAPETK